MNDDNQRSDTNRLKIVRNPIFTRIDNILVLNCNYSYHNCIRYAEKQRVPVVFSVELYAAVKPFVNYYDLWDCVHEVIGSPLRYVEKIEPPVVALEGQLDKPENN